MSEHLTIVYLTFRKDPRIEWFFESLNRESASTPCEFSVVVVNCHEKERVIESTNWFTTYVPPKPSVWQGPHRLTSKDYFAASNARNTGLCLAPDGWIAYVDDLSVVMPGWLNAVRRAMDGNYIVFGAYKKVLELEYLNGVATYKDYPPGLDSRWHHGGSEPVIAAGSWLYGCSLAAPVEAFLRINGWDEDADSLGSEDSIAGIMLEKHGYSFRYDRSMLTLESEEGHHKDAPLPRFDKGVSPHDKSHAILNRTMRSRATAHNYFGPGGIRAERERVLRGEPFTLPTAPTHDWFDQTPLSEY